MKKFEELDVIDDFLVNVLANDVEVGEEFCKSLVKGLLQRELGKIRVNVQRVITPETPKQRGIRLDVEILELEQEGMEEECVCKVKTLPEVRSGYMTLEEKIFYERLDAREEGREEGRLEVAKKLLQKGMSVEEVCELLECDAEYVKMIQAEMKEK